MQPYVYIIKGPALIEYQKKVFYSKGNIKLSALYKVDPIATDFHGALSFNHRDIFLSLTFTPTHIEDTNHLSILYPHLDKKTGSDLIESSPLIIRTKSGEKIIFENVAMTQMPALKITAKKIEFGPMTFRLFSSTKIEQSKRHFAVSKENGVNFPCPQNMPCFYPQIAWGKRYPFNNLSAIDTICIDFNLNIRPIFNFSGESKCLLLENLSVRTSFIPVLPSNERNFMEYALDHSEDCEKLTISSLTHNFEVEIPHAYMDSSVLANWHTSNHAVGEVIFKARLSNLRPILSFN